MFLNLPIFVKIEEKLTKSDQKYRDAFNQTLKLKDTYSHDLGNILQNIQLSLEMSPLVPNEQEKNTLNELTLKKLKEASDLIKKIRDL